VIRAKLIGAVQANVSSEPGQGGKAQLNDDIIEAY
jgi:hypothetical protein